MASLRRSRRFAFNSRPARCVHPVMLPLGCAKRGTRPLPTGSATNPITMGIVVVACLAARAAGVAEAKMRSTLRLTRPTASSRRRSCFPSASRTSMAMFRPSTQPSWRSPSRNASKCGEPEAADPNSKYPIRNVFEGGCASAASDVARRLPPIPAMNARRSIGITDPRCCPFRTVVLRPLPACPARTSAEASGATVSSDVAIKKHGGLPGGADSTGPRSAAAPSRARPNYRCRRTGSGRPRTFGGSARRPPDPRDVRVGSARWPPDAPDSIREGSPGGGSRGSLGPEPPGRGRA